MSLKITTPCNYIECPYDAQYFNTCEYYCGADEPYDEPQSDEFYDTGVGYYLFIN